jgi:hypothetical protein
MDERKPQPPYKRASARGEPSASGGTCWGQVRTANIHNIQQGTPSVKGVEKPSPHRLTTFQRLAANFTPGGEL